MEGGDTDDKGKEDAQVQGQGLDANEEPAELTGDRRYNEYTGCMSGTPRRRTSIARTRVRAATRTRAATS